MNKVIHVFILAAALVGFTGSAFADDLQIVVRNFKSTEGSVLVSIFDDAESFPDQPTQAVMKLKLTVEQAKNFLVQGLAPGEYAIAVLHDENGNGKMDKNGIGIPKEGFCFSNDAMGTFGPPSYKKAKFTVKGPLTTQMMKLKHF